MVVMVFAVLAIATFILNKYYERISHIQELADLKDRRYIRFREWLPNYTMYTTPHEDVDYYQNLEEREYILRTDSQGFIQPGFIHQQADVSIFFIGGSTTECLYMDEEARFPYLAGRLLEGETGQKINSLNCGRSGNNSIHSNNILYNKLAPYHPDIVVMSHAINDLATLAHYRSYWHPDSYNNSRSATVKLKLKDIHQFEPQQQPARLLFNIAPYAYMGISTKLNPPPLPEEFEELPYGAALLDSSYLADFKNNLEIFISICRDIDAQPVLMTQANNFKLGIAWVEKDSVLTRRYTNPNDPEFFNRFNTMYQLFNQTTREVAREKNVPLIDLDSLIPAGHQYIYDEVHYNSKGSELAARHIYQQLLRIISPASDSLHSSLP